MYQPKKWVIADTHFHSTFMLKYFHLEMGREIPDTKKYDALLVNYWNSIVDERDIVFVIGDFSDNPHNLNQDFGLLHKLHGTKTLILGNHDFHFRTLDYWKGGLQDKMDGASYWLNAGFDRVVDDRLELELLGVHFLLTHEPVDTEPGVYNVHGHNHEHTSSDPAKINVAATVNRFKPVSLFELALERADESVSAPILEKRAQFQEEREEKRALKRQSRQE